MDYQINLSSGELYTLAGLLHFNCLLMRQYAEIEGITEELKRSDQMEWTHRMNSIRNCVEEFVLHDFVYA